MEVRLYARIHGSVAALYSVRIRSTDEQGECFGVKPEEFTVLLSADKGDESQSYLDYRNGTVT